MVNVTVEGLVKSYGSNTVVDGLDLSIEMGEFLVLLGPSGCGKTTSLRCLAGLETPSAGRISFGGRAVFEAGRINLNPDKRNVGMVFQSYALWPHMTVRENIAYPLKVRKLKNELRAGWVEDAASMVDCSMLLDRYPAQLSGGQQQRVALARGLVNRPDLVLFDEPMSNLDARLRDLVRAQLHQLHRKLGFSAVFVTHDQQEALALGDRIAIMNGGRIEQYDTPQRVFERPATDFVAKFIGMSNRFECERTTDGWSVAGHPVVLPAHARVDGDSLVARIRPDDVTIARESDPAEGHLAVLPGRIVDVQYLGTYFDVMTEVGRQTFHARVLVRSGNTWVQALEAGTQVSVRFDMADARFFPEVASVSAQEDQAVVAA